MTDKIKCPHCAGKGFLTPATATIGDMVKLKRMDLGISQQDVANHTSLSRAQIANLEGGRTDIPASKLRLFAEVLKCSVADLVP